MKILLFVISAILFSVPNLQAQLHLKSSRFYSPVESSDFKTTVWRGISFELPECMTTNELEDTFAAFDSSETFTLNITDNSRGITSIDDTKNLCIQTMDENGASDTDISPFKSGRLKGYQASGHLGEDYIRTIIFVKGSRLIKIIAYYRAASIETAERFTSSLQTK